MVADCFSSVTRWNIDGFKNGDLLLSPEASGKGELVPFNSPFHGVAAGYVHTD